MTRKPDNDSAIKNGLHPRNPHRFRYDFNSLAAACPELKAHISLNQYGDESVNFADPAAVKALNKAILMHFYGISFWDIPENYLCPPIPGRADYIHYAADLLASCCRGIIPRGGKIRILDIGIGANCVYPIIGNHEYGWHFTGSDIDHVSINSAQKIIDSNETLKGEIELRLQRSSEAVLHGIIKQDEFFDAVICNPPFHSSPEDAEAGTLRKLSNLNSKPVTKAALNFGGQNRELWTPGGEESFIGRMIEESSDFAGNCLWFTTLISKKTTLPGVQKALKKIKAADIKIIDMAQGQKISRIAAWSFMNKPRQMDWNKNR